MPLCNHTCFLFCTGLCVRNIVINFSVSFVLKCNILLVCVHDVEKKNCDG